MHKQQSRTFGIPGLPGGYGIVNLNYKNRIA